MSDGTLTQDEINALLSGAYSTDRVDPIRKTLLSKNCMMKVLVTKRLLLRPFFCLDNFEISREDYTDGDKAGYHLYTSLR